MTNLYYIFKCFFWTSLVFERHCLWPISTWKHYFWFESAQICGFARKQKIKTHKQPVYMYNDMYPIVMYGLYQIVSFFCSLIVSSILLRLLTVYIKWFNKKSLKINSICDQNKINVAFSMTNHNHIYIAPLMETRDQASLSRIVIVSIISTMMHWHKSTIIYSPIDHVCVLYSHWHYPSEWTLVNHSWHNVWYVGYVT